MLIVNMARQPTFPKSFHDPMPKKDTFKHKIIALTGDFGADKPYDKIKAWIKHAGGVYAPEISNCVTHLICSKRDFKANNKIGKRCTPRYGFNHMKSGR